MAAAGALLLAAGCSSSPPRDPTAEGPTVAVPSASSPSEPLVLVSEPSTPPTGPSLRGAEQGIADARRAPAFAEDAAELALNMGCRGDCPSPFQMATASKDEAQVRARVGWCVRAAERRGPVPTASGLVSGKIAADGRLRDPQVQAVQKVAGQRAALPEDVAACVRELVSTARFTPPEHGPERPLYTAIAIGEAPGEERR
jgi:hypothetical protein